MLLARKLLHRPREHDINCEAYRIYTGLQLDEPTNQLTCFIGWNTVQQHENVSVMSLRIETFISNA